MEHEAYLRSMPAAVASAADEILDAANVELLDSVSAALAAEVEDGKSTPSRQQAAMAARAEGPLTSAVEAMDYAAVDLAARPGQEPIVAAAVEDLRARVAAVLADARRVQEDYLRRIAEEDEEEDVIGPEEASAVREAASAVREAARAMAELDGGGRTLVASSAEKAAAAAAVGEAAAEAMAEEMAELAGRIRAGAAAFASRPGEDRGLAEKLLSKAEKAEMHGKEAQAMAATFSSFRFSPPV